MNRIRRTVSVFAATMLALVLGATAALAQDGGVEELAEDAFSDLTSTITTTLAPALLGLVIAGVIVALIVRWVRKARSAG